MTERTLTRREFLRGTTRIGVTLALATALAPPVHPVQADEGSFISVLGGLDVLRTPEVQGWLGAGVGPLWVAGRVLSTFAGNLAFENLPSDSLLRSRIFNAGGDYKSLPAARAFWETIPAPVRASGPEAVSKFLKGKDWSHFIPRSWGGPTTAENGIWWSSAKNKSLGPNPMSEADIADARAVLRTAAIRATLVQTLRGMVRGAMIGVVAGGLLACLEYGLQYAEGKITWERMVYKIVEATLIAGAGAFIAAGLIVGLSLAFPFLIPIFLPVLFALQIVALVFLWRQLVPLAQGWWEALDGQELLEDSYMVLKDVGTGLRRISGEVKEGFSSVVGDWVAATADLFGIDRAWEMAIALVQRLGLDGALTWFAAQTDALTRKAADLTTDLRSWDNLPEAAVDVSYIRESIASVVTAQFQDAISTTDELLRSIDDYRKGASLKAADSLLVV